MSFFGWLQSLITFRKSTGNELTVPRLDSQGRIRISTVESNANDVGPTPPSGVDGYTLWNNTTTGNEGVFFYDLSRSKWLSIAEKDFDFGHDSTDGSDLRPTGIRTTRTNTGYIVRKDATIVGLTIHGSGNNAAKDFNIVINGVVNSTYTTASFDFISSTLNIDISAGDILSMSSATGGASTQDITAQVTTRWRE